MRLISICPSNTEIVHLLGLSPLLVGLDRASDWPPEVQKLPRVGHDLSIDVEKIRALSPDLVLSSTSVPGMEKNLEALDRAGLPHVVVDASSIQGVLDSVRLVGRLLGHGERAGQVVAELQARLDAVRAKSEHLSRRARIFLEWWPKPLISPGRPCWTTEMMALAGGENIFADLDTRSAPVDPDLVVRRSPDLILTCWCAVPHTHARPMRVSDRPGWEHIPAVMSGQVYTAEEPFFGRPGPRIVDGVEWLHGLVAQWAQFEDENERTFEVEA